ncbi:MAG: hypothetical protein WBV28_01170, partial [Terracidiphilus sp.]
MRGTTMVMGGTGGAMIIGVFMGVTRMLCTAGGRGTTTWGATGATGAMTGPGQSGATGPSVSTSTTGSLGAASGAGC